MITPKLIDFLAYWVQTSASYNTLFAKTMTAEWAKQHQFIISHHGRDPSRFTKYAGPTPPAMPPSPPCPDDHILYTLYACEEPMGMLAQCYNRGCTRGVTGKKRGAKVIITCSSCLWQREVPSYTTDQETLLGHRGVITVGYPQAGFPLLEGRKPVPPPLRKTAAPPDLLRRSHSFPEASTQQPLSTATSSSSRRNPPKSKKKVTLTVHSHWGQGPKYPPATCWIHWEYRQQVTPMCPVGKSWVY